MTLVTLKGGDAKGGFFFWRISVITFVSFDLEWPILQVTQVGRGVFIRARSATPHPNGVGIARAPPHRFLDTAAVNPVNLGWTLDFRFNLFWHACIVSYRQMVAIPEICGTPTLTYSDQIWYRNTGEGGACFSRSVTLSIPRGWVQASAQFLELGNNFWWHKCWRAICLR